MKLYEIHRTDMVVIAWLEPSNDTGDMQYCLKCIQPAKVYYDFLISAAERDRKPDRVELLKRQCEDKIKSNQPYFTPTLGRWASVEDFHAGRYGERKVNKGKIFNMYPRLRVAKSKEEAIKLAKRERLI